MVPAPGRPPDLFDREQEWAGLSAFVSTTMCAPVLDRP